MKQPPFRCRSTASIMRSSCYNGGVGPTFIRRAGPHFAVSTGNSTSVGRPAEYNTLGEYAGRVRPVLARDEPTRLAGRSGRAWGNELRTICVSAMALALAACTSVDNDGNGQDAASEPAPILDLLASGDITACAHPAVLSIFDENSQVSFEEAQKKLSLTRDQYDAVGPDDFSLTDVSAAEANKDIAEVKCEANLHVMGHNLGVVRYAVRPQSSGEGIVASFDPTLGQAMALAKSDHMSALESAAPKPRKQSATVVRDEPSDGADPAPASEEPPVSAYDKARAALTEAADTGN